MRKERRHSRRVWLGRCRRPLPSRHAATYGH
jgi:hypothetical protein